MQWFHGALRAMGGAQAHTAAGWPAVFALRRAYAANPPNSAALIKELREKSSAPISDVRSCLALCDWDMERAYELLRKKGLAAAAKKASRHAAEGLVGLAQDPRGCSAAIVEVNSETDFVARNERFMQLVMSAARTVLQLPAPEAGYAVPPEQLAVQPLGAGQQALQEACAELAASMRENIRLRRGFLLTSPGVVGCYVHGAVAPGLGRIASLVALEGPTGPIDEGIVPRARELSTQLAMHVAGMKPRYLSGDDIPPSVLAHERAVLTEQAANSGKPAQVVAKMVEGRLSKWRDEVCLLQQRFLLDDTQSVSKVVAAMGSGGAGGMPALRVAAFLRVQVGEGLEQVQQDGKDFATEVAKMAAAAGQ